MPQAPWGGARSEDPERQPPNRGPGAIGAPGSRSPGLDPVSGAHWEPRQGKRNATAEPSQGSLAPFTREPPAPGLHQAPSVRGGP
ncbi:hypothetical protein JCM10135_08690 [Stetteria hydrogenophila]